MLCFLVLFFSSFPPYLFIVLYVTIHHISQYTCRSPYITCHLTTSIQFNLHPPFIIIINFIFMLLCLMSQYLPITLFNSVPYYLSLFGFLSPSCHDLWYIYTYLFILSFLLYLLVFLSYHPFSSFFVLFFLFFYCYLCPTLSLFSFFVLGLIRGHLYNTIKHQTHGPASTQQYHPYQLVFHHQHPGVHQVQRQQHPHPTDPSPPPGSHPLPPQITVSAPQIHIPGDMGSLPSHSTPPPHSMSPGLQAKQQNRVPVPAQSPGSFHPNVRKVRRHGNSRCCIRFDTFNLKEYIKIKTALIGQEMTCFMVSPA